MRSLEAIAGDLLKAALEAAPHERGPGFGKLTTLELARLAVEHIGTCPRCGAEAGADIDCFVCDIVEKIRKGEEPPFSLPEWIHMF